jgi:hypothetical protein
MTLYRGIEITKFAVSTVATPNGPKTEHRYRGIVKIDDGDTHSSQTLTGSTEADVQRQIDALLGPEDQE